MSGGVVNRQDFLQNLESIQAGLSPKPTVSQSDCFLFKDGAAHAFNGEIACSTNSGLPEDLACAVHGQPLLEVLRKLVDEELTVSVEVGQLTFRAGGKKFGVRLEKEILLPMDKVEKPGKWLPLHEDFGEAVRLTSQCCGRDDSQWVLTHVHLTPTHMESSDHVHHLCRYKVETPIKKDILIKATAFRHVTSVEMNKFSEGDNWIHFKNATGLVYSVIRTVDAFPNFTAFLKVDGHKVSLPKGLGEAVANAAVFSLLNDREDHEVRVDLRPGKGIRVRGDGATGFYQEVKAVKYEGQALSFLIKPDILIEITKGHQEATVNSDHLMVDTGKFRYVTCLRKLERS